jgi:hypothetical protein
MASRARDSHSPGDSALIGNREHRPCGPHPAGAGSAFDQLGEQLAVRSAAQCGIHHDQATGGSECRRAVEGRALERRDRLPPAKGDLLRRESHDVTDDVARQGGLRVRRLHDVHGRRMLEQREAPSRAAET